MQPPPVLSGCDLVKQELAKYDSWDVNVMTAISKAESGCRLNARGDGHLTFQQNGRTYGYSLGPLQVRILPGREHCDTLNTSVLVRCAYDIYKNQGYRAWSVYLNGCYARFL